MRRRTLLKVGLGAAAVLAVAGGTLSLLHPGLVDGRLTESGRAVFEAVARAVLDGSLPADATQRQSAIAAHLKRLDDTLAALPRPTRTELSQLLGLLGAAPGRVALAGLHTDWSEASVDELQLALQGLRTSSVAMRQQAYHALRDLTNAAYYVDPSAWSLMGYPGPRDV